MKRFMKNFSDDQSLHHIMKVEKKTFTSYIYTLFLDLFYIDMRENSMGIKRNTRHIKVIYRQVLP